MPEYHEVLLAGLERQAQPIWLDNYSFALLKALFECTDNQGYAEVTQRELLERSHMSMAAIGSRLKDLEGQKLIAIENVPHNKKYNRYKLNEAHPFVRNVYAVGLTAKGYVRRRVEEVC